MPAPIIDGLATYLEAQLAVPFWDGEVPQQDEDGQNIDPPFFRVLMLEEGLERNWTMADPYDDSGPMLIEIYDTTRASVEEKLGLIETLLANESNWPLIVLPGGPAINPYSVFNCQLRRWSSRQMEGVRTKDSQLVYRGYWLIDIGIHGAIQTSNARI